MGFSNTLRRNAVNEWKDYYVDYEQLRVRIKNRDFKSMLYAEVNKINSFYFLLEKKAVNEKYHLFNEIIPEMPVENPLDTKSQDSEADEARDSADGFGRSTNESENDNKSFIEEKGLSKYIPLKKGYTRRKKEKLITEFLHNLVKIKAYRDLNSSGLLKLAKKYSVLFQNEIFYEKFNQKLQETYFYKSKRVDAIRNVVKKAYKKTFAKDQPEKAKTVFNRLGRGSKTLDIYYIISGFFAGITFGLSCQYVATDSSEYKFMCGINNCYFGFFLFGLCLKTFKYYSINYKFIFNFDVVSSMNNSIYLLLVSSLMLISNIAYYFKDSISALDTTDLISLMPLVFIFNPLDVLCFNSRIYLISSFSKGLFLPVSTIRFRHFYFVDILQSFKFPIEAVILHLFSNSINKKTYAKSAYLLFPTVRILQCLKRFTTSRLPFPHIANTGKYLLSLLFLFFDILSTNGYKNPNLQTLIVGLRLMSSIASFSWDVLIDWVILRNRYMFPKAFYTFAVIFNFAVRFYWTKTFFTRNIVGGTKDDSRDHVVIESLAEIIRRFMWTLIRVEVEHLNNCDELKMKKSINLTSGEFFYKKDVVENYLQGEDFNNETEFETEMEDNSESKKEANASEDTETEVTENDSLEEHEDEETSDSEETE